MTRSLLAVGLVLLGLSNLGEAAAVTPIQKVIELLKNLEAKLEQESKDEAAAYDKYACFCKEQADNKIYAKERSIAKIEKLDAEIDKLDSEITALGEDIAALAKKISETKDSSKSAQEQRDGEHKAYVADEADASGAISACLRAVAALKESRGNMGGKTEGTVLTQVRSVAALAVAFAGRADLSAGQVRSLTVLAKPGTAYESAYHSNDIIATIEDLHARFKKVKADLDQAEFDANARHDKLQLSLANEIKFAEKEKGEKETLLEDKTENKEAKEADRTQELKEKNADMEFLAELTNECQNKATLWDQRSSTRAAELTAISDAMRSLEEGAAPNYKANKKLVGIQRHQSVRSTSADLAQPSSFFQVRALRGNLRGKTTDAQIVAKVQEFLQSSGMRLRSPVLSAAALKVSVSEDHFAKVRSIIKDLVARLEDQAEAEATQKAYCDENMKKEVDKRDEQQSIVEDLKAQISSAEAKKAQLVADIAEKSQEIADNNKALKEKTELREAEHLENSQTVKDATTGREAVEQAIEVLKKFYEGAAFTQYVPPKSDREGLTVSDRAPEVFDSEYKGNQDASKGIIGMLEVILEDFKRTVSTVTDQEDDAQSDFNTFKEDIEKDTSEKEDSKTLMEGEVADTEDKLVQLMEDEKTAQTKLALAKEALEDLHSQCVAGEETYEERVAKRKQEIEALKEAHGILEDWSK